MSGAAIPVGVVGVGSLGFHHARILREVAGAAMVGIHDANPERARDVATELGVRAFATADELFSQIEAAVISVPTTDHAEVALSALDHGVHVLIEKPLATSLEEADAILASASKNGLLVGTGHVERFNSAVRAAEQYLSEPRFIESHRLASFGPRGTDVAVVLDLMIHDIDLILGLTRRPLLRSDAAGVPVLTPNIDIANARLVFEGGLVANITASRVSRERMRKIRMFQASGYLSLDLGAGSGEFLRLREGASLGMLNPETAQLQDIVERIEIKGDDREPLRAELESFVAAVRGESDLVVSGDDGRQALSAALDIVASIEKNVFDPRTA